MLTVIYLALISVAVDAAVVAKRNQSDAKIYPEANAVIAQNETTDASQPGDNLDDGRPTAKDTQIERSPSWKVEERGPPDNNFHDTTQKISPRNNITKASSSQRKNAMINDGFKVYFGDDERSPTTRMPKPVPEDDGKIYFEPMLHRKNATKTSEKDSESNIMRIDHKNRTTETTTMSSTSDGVTLDNRNAFSADAPCNPGQSKVMGKCVNPE